MTRTIDAFPTLKVFFIPLALVAAVAASNADPRVFADCTGLADGTACEDGNACTLGETCLSDDCVAPVALTPATGSSIPVATFPVSVATADLNKDGRLDLAVASAANAVAILLGNGLGGFIPAPGSPFAVVNRPTHLALGDWNGDSEVDLAVAGDDSSDVTILLGDGSGGFSQAPGSPVAVGQRPAYVAVGDWNADLDLDLAVANSDSDSVTILLGDGAGGFGQAGSPISVGTLPYSIGVGDWNHDSRLDLAVVNVSSENVTILLGNGSGGFGEAPGSPTSVGTSPQVQQPRSVVVGDWNGDSSLDLAVANDSDNVTILQGDGAGGFDPVGAPVPAGPSPAFITSGDWNDDGKPDLVVANGGQLTILLGNGAGVFGPPVGSPVPMGGSPRSVAVGDWNEDGKQDLAVAKIYYDDLVLLMGNGSGQFSQLTSSPVATALNPRSVALGDLNDDGKLDFVVANMGSDQVTIFMGTGAGGFGTPASVATGTSPYSVALGDVNGDGRPDLAVANYGSGNVSMWLGNGSGGFTPATGSPLQAGSAPVSVAFGDLNRDGKLDVVVANYGTNDATILLGNGSGAFTQAAGSPVALGAHPLSIVVGDWNGDGTLDLASAIYGSNGVAILLGNGSGGFSQAASSPIVVGSAPAHLAVGDVNDDGDLDLGVVNYGSSDVTILLGNGTGAFSQATGSPVAVDTHPMAGALADWNGDGKLDFIVANYAAGDLTVLMGSGTGAFSPAASSPIVVGAYPTSVAAGDLNGDGKLDVAVTNFGSGNVILLYNAGFAANGTACADASPCTVAEACASGRCTAPGSLTEAALSPIAVAGLPSSVVTGDFDGDGEQDLAIASYSFHRLTILLGNGAGGFVQPAGSPVPMGTNPHAIGAGDWNGDGKVDLAVVNYGSHNVTILLGNGTGGFSRTTVAVGLNPRSIAVGDWNADGKQDLAVANQFTNDVTVLLGNGSGGFAPAAGSPVAAGSNPRSVAAGDWNGDGKQDLAVANYGANSVAVLLGNGSGGFSHAAGSPLVSGMTPIAVVAGDWNADGNADLAVANYTTDDVTILLGNGAAGFSRPAGAAVVVGTRPDSIAVGDWNGDGNADLAVANGNSRNVTLLRGNGLGGFREVAGSPFPAGTTPYSVAMADVSGDGKLDVVVANQGSNNVTLLLNDAPAAPDGTPCNDSIACTTSDTCTGLACSGTPVAPSEVDDGVRVERSGTDAVLSWNAAPDATASDVLRGDLSAFPIGPAGGDEVCVADDLVTTMATDTAAPAASTGYWYLIRGANACGNGAYGFEGAHGSAGSPRLSTTCP